MEFRESPSRYLDRFPMNAEQRTAIETRGWVGMLRLGGNIYYTFKIAILMALPCRASAATLSKRN